jgi:NitT/TauT family transport system substrate-binding protein
VPKPAAPAPAAPAVASPAVAASPAAAAAPATPPLAKPGEITTIQLGVVVNLNYAPVYVGMEKGIFNKYGLDLKIKTFPGGSEVTKALQAGEIELGAANFSNVIAARAAGAQLKGFWLFQNDALKLNNDDLLSVIVPPTSPIQKIGDLAGKKIALTVGGSIDPYMRLTLQDAGVDPKNVELLNTVPGNIASSVKSGAVDAGLFQEPYGEQYLSEVPNARVLVRGGGRVSFRILAISRDDWLPKNGPVVERLAAALAESQQYARQHIDEAADASVVWLSGLTSPVARKAIRYIAFDPRVSQIVRDSWEIENKSLIDLKRINQPIPLADGFDTSVTEQTTQKYPQLFSDLPALPR